VAVSVHDVEAVVSWYSTHLGFRLLGKIAHIKRSADPEAAIFAIYPPSLNEVKLAYMSTGNGVGFEVFEFVDPKPVAATVAPEGEEFRYEKTGFFHVCVTDPDPDALAERVVKAGGRRIGKTVDPGNVGVKCLYLADPWGNVVEVLSVSFEWLACRTAF
jgi:catechol 2,3-dioxygenase-like lactoylglutathione lyase family enzyme